MNLNERLQACLRPDPSAVDHGIRLALWQGTGAAVMPEAVAEHLDGLEDVTALIRTAAARSSPPKPFPKAGEPGNSLVCGRLGDRVSAAQPGPPCCWPTA
ncbi:MAG: hypothetical protein ACK40D_11950 [Cyanobacteriota bacterium]|jgi:hypothetical protein